MRSNRAEGSEHRPADRASPWLREGATAALPSAMLGLILASSMVTGPAGAADTPSPAPTAAAASTAAVAQTDLTPAAASAASRAGAIEAAVQTMRSEAAASGKTRSHRLRWIDDDSTPDDHPPDHGAWPWLVQLARFLADSSRLLLYALAAMLVAVLLVGARHVVQLRSLRRRTGPPPVVSHVRELDVRPDSLPENIGAAAWALWRAGQVPEALSLLYRGALSRLIHRHAVPIAGSSTEGDCLALAQGRITPPAYRYLTQVVRAREATS